MSKAADVADMICRAILIERERCAKVVEDFAQDIEDASPGFTHLNKIRKRFAQHSATKIRHGIQ